MPGVREVRALRARWVGHALHADLQIVVDDTLSLRDSHHVVEEVRHALFHAHPRLSSITVHVLPTGYGEEGYESITAHHER